MAEESGDGRDRREVARAMDRSTWELREDVFLRFAYLRLDSRDFLPAGFSQFDQKKSVRPRHWEPDA